MKTIALLAVLATPLLAQTPQQATKPQTGHLSGQTHGGNVSLTAHRGMVENIKAAGTITITGDENTIKNVHAKKVVIIGLNNKLIDVDGYKDGLYPKLTSDR